MKPCVAGQPELSLRPSAGLGPKPLKGITFTKEHNFTLDKALAKVQPPIFQCCSRFSHLRFLGRPSYHDDSHKGFEEYHGMRLRSGHGKINYKKVYVNRIRP